MKSSWLALPLLVAAASAIFAQQPVITPETPVNSTTLQQWLHSGDPRLIAWAADFARRTHDSELVQQMPALLEHWTIPPLDGADHSQAAQRRAVIAVLDTLIQENVQVPISGIQAVAEFFPAQAAILINRLPLTESRSTLDAWFAGVTGGWQARLLARIASMMLAKEPDPSFVGGWRTLELCFVFRGRYLAVGAALCAVFAGCVRAISTAPLLDVAFGLCQEIGLR